MLCSGGIELPCRPQLLRVEFGSSPFAVPRLQAQLLSKASSSLHLAWTSLLASHLWLQVVIYFYVVPPISLLISSCLYWLQALKSERSSGGCGGDVVLICVCVLILSSGQQAWYLSLLEVTHGSWLLVCVLCLLYLTAKYNIKYNNNDCLKTFFWKKCNLKAFFCSVVEQGEVEAKEEGRLHLHHWGICFINTMAWSIRFSAEAWCKGIRVGHRCARGAMALNHLSSCMARVKGEAIYINYWRAVNIISWYHIKINLIKLDIKRQNDLLLVKDTIKGGAWG